MSRKAVDALLQLRETHRFLRGMVQWLGFAVAEVPFQPAPRKAGISKYTWRRMLHFACDGLLSFSKVPLRLAMVLGLAGIAFSILFGGWTALRLLLSSSPVDLGWAWLLFSIHLTGGCVLFALGLIGEYVGRIYDQVRARPLYLLKDQSPALIGGRPRSALDSLPGQPYREPPDQGRSAA
jgi:hypothetical protein